MSHSAIHGIFRTNLALAVHCCSLARRRLTKQFLCHHVRLKWKSDFTRHSCGAPEPIVLPFRETDSRCLVSGVIFMTRLMP